MDGPAEESKGTVDCSSFRVVAYFGKVSLVLGSWGVLGIGGGKTQSSIMPDRRLSSTTSMRSPLMAHAVVVGADGELVGFRLFGVVEPLGGVDHGHRVFLATVQLELDNENLQRREGP